MISAAAGCCTEGESCTCLMEDLWLDDVHTLVKQVPCFHTYRVVSLEGYSSGQGADARRVCAGH